jgi:hypothetical protein
MYRVELPTYMRNLDPPFFFFATFSHLLARTNIEVSHEWAKQHEEVWRVSAGRNRQSHRET